MFSSDWMQEIVALVVAGLALAYVVRHFRPKKKRSESDNEPNAKLGGRLARGLKKAQRKSD
jgi:membrane protein implicated in regulation of membrane protease activity